MVPTSGLMLGAVYALLFVWGMRRNKGFCDSINRHLPKQEILVIFEAVTFRCMLAYYKGGLEVLKSRSVISISISAKLESAPQTPEILQYRQLTVIQYAVCSIQGYRVLIGITLHSTHIHPQLPL
ncbi:hypothetical protein EV127DRAFT_414733 [Xylaria flabelliformis]|nr:hypothetical protein EV127DRAFT_414733 [Xylaria flabelliformis]